MLETLEGPSDGLFALALLMTLPVAMFSTLLFGYQVGVAVLAFGWLVATPVFATLSDRGPFRRWLGMEEREPPETDDEVRGLWTDQE